jgi:hypothetical protein
MPVVALLQSAREHPMRIQMLGVRGSTPAPDADFVRYGGHTSCLAITAQGRSFRDRDLPPHVQRHGLTAR